MARPLIYLASKVDGKRNKVALRTALQLWGVAFNDVTKTRRRNIPRETGPKLETLLNNSDNFNEEECNMLFGKYFRAAMVTAAKEEELLNAVGRAGGPSNFPGKGKNPSISSSKGHYLGRNGGGNSNKSHFNGAKDKIRKTGMPPLLYLQFCLLFQIVYKMGVG